MKKNWEIKKLGEVCEVIAGQSPEGKFYNQDKKGTPFYQGKKDFGLKYLDKPTVWTTVETKIALENDILMSVRAPVGDINICTSRVCIGRGLAAIRASEAVNNDFLFYFLLSIKSKITGKEGAVFASINRQEIAALQIPIPPLSEQKRIVKILDEKFAHLESLKANAQTNLQNAKDLFQSQLSQAFEQKDCHTDSGLLTQSQKKDFKDFPLGKSNPCGNKWKTVRLGDCGTFKNGMNFAATDSGYTIRSLGVGDFKDRYSIDDTETLSEISLKAAPSEDYLLHDGDIVFVRSNGNKELVGRCLLVYPKDIPTTYSGFCIRFRKDFDLLDADFLLHFMKAESSRKILNGKEGANISNLNQKILGDFEVPLPPLPEQKRIVKELDTLSKKVKALCTIYEKQIADCEELKQAYLQKAFDAGL